MEFEKIYKQWFDDLEKEKLSFSEKKSLDSSWDAIEEVLILDDTWTRIGTALGPTPSASTPASSSTGGSFLKPLYWIPLAVILGIALIWWLAPSTEKEETRKADLTENERSGNMIPDEFNDSEIIATPDNDRANTPISNRNATETPRTETGTTLTVNSRNEKELTDPKIPFIETRKEPLPPIIGEEIPSMGKVSTSIENGHLPVNTKNSLLLGPLNLSLPDLPESFLENHTYIPDFYPGGILPAPAMRNWYFYALGISLSFNNSWIINDETLAGLNPESLTDTRLSYAPEIGISAMLASRKGQRIELELFLFSEQKQAYNQYINARYQEKELTLAYQKAHISWYVPIKIFPGRLGIGAFGSHLSGASETIGSVRRDVTEEYNRFDYGLSLDYKLEFAMTDRLIFSPAFRIQYSLPNIFKGNSSIPGEFRRTRNASAGINLGIHYRF